MFVMAIRICYGKLQTSHSSQSEEPFVPLPPFLTLAGEAIPDSNVTFWNLHILWERVEPFPKI